jgi:hypothetical protein
MVSIAVKICVNGHTFIKIYLLDFSALGFTLVSYLASFLFFFNIPCNEKHYRKKQKMSKAASKSFCLDGELLAPIKRGKEVKKNLDFTSKDTARKRPKQKLSALK